MPAVKIRVLIVDDSTFVRTILHHELSRHPQIEVAGFAVDGIDALHKIAQLRPDVVTLDVEMPRLNGIGVLERVVGKARVGFIIVSSLTQAGASVTIKALQKGAFDYVAKPSSGGIADVPEFRTRLHEKVLGAARANGRSPRGVSASAGTTPVLSPKRVEGWTVLIGISCGGPQTLMEMLPAFPADFAPILVTQHMPAEFTRSFAHTQVCACRMSVKEAEHHDGVRPGHIYIAPGDRHMKLVGRGPETRINLDGGPLVSGHRPSVDAMLEAAARICGPRAVAVIMTGMGNDGAAGVVKMRQAGARTIAQDEETSLVYGMPKAAYETGAIEHVVPLPAIPLVTSRLLAGSSLRPYGAVAR